MRILLVVVTAAGLAVGQGTSSWKGDGNSLLRFCSAYIQAADNGTIPSGGAIGATFCVGFLTGIQDYDEMLSQLETDRNGGKGLVRHACVPQNATTDEVVRVVVKWLRDNPHELNYPASVLAIGALRKAYPCKQ
jgi:hypothetical protein